MKTLKFKGTEVSLSFDSYQNNGSLAVLMNTVPDDELYVGISQKRPCWPRIPFLLTRYLFATKSIFS